VEKNTTEPRKNTKNEKYVINPKPRPVRPKIFCSSGAPLEIIIMIICNKAQKKLAKRNFFIRGFSYDLLIDTNKFGSRYIETHNAIETLGIIKASKFVGVNINVARTAPKTITL
jgi:hypothetical protein